MKGKLLAFIACGIFAGALALGGCAAGPDGQAPEEQPAASGELAVEPELEPVANMANPWQSFGNAADAAAFAGVGSFVVPEGSFAGMEVAEGPVFMAAEGIAQADYGFPTAMATVRKGIASAQPEGAPDIAGIYTDFPVQWTVDVNGMQVSCSGNEAGLSMKTLWNTGDYAYSIAIQGIGGDESFGLTGAQVVEAVAAIQ